MSTNKVDSLIKEFNSLFRRMRSLKPNEYQIVEEQIEILKRKHMSTKHINIKKSDSSSFSNYLKTYS
jgi:beta-lactamase regulating signal transducer with metallopeptidase domain